MTTPLASGAHSTGQTTPELDTGWHRQATEDVLSRFGSSSDNGLTSDVATARLDEHGPNELVDQGSRSPWRILWEQLTAVMVLILVAASLLSLALGKLLEAGAIGAIVVLFALLGFVQEYRAERAIAALRRMATPTVRVVRDGLTVEVPSAELVPGDLVQLEAGNTVSADLRLVETANLRIQEATLTGESEPVDKRTDPIDRDDLPLGDRRSMAYAGTQVSYGRGRGVVVATGMATELGRIASLLQGVEAEPTPLQDRLDRVGKQLALLGVAVAVAVVILGAIAGQPIADLALTAISVAVAVIPEGLPAVVTLTLAIGAQRMLRRNSLVRKLPAVETLGSVTVICSDKTGTLTQNQMTATIVDVAGHRLAVDDIDLDDPDPAHVPAVAITLAAAVLCNDGEFRIEPDGDMVLIGDPTETALLRAAHDSGIDPAALRQQAPRAGEVPFESDRKRMATIHAPLRGHVASLAPLPQDVPVAFVKGAIDGLLHRSRWVWDAGHPVELDNHWRNRVLAANESLAAGGMRVLGVAYRTLEPAEVGDGAGPDGGYDADRVENDLTIVGLVGIIDPPRPEVRDAVATCRAAGIRPIMITGDHPATAVAIACDLGITTDERALTGADLEHLDANELSRAVRDTDVFARVSPEHKLRIVESLQHQGHVVAMTGDGVNDAPALKRADIGVAMGITGTDVSKEAADMVLRDDNFTTIVAAVEEGRVIYDNLRRFVSFAVAGNLGKILVMLVWPLYFLALGGDTDGTGGDNGAAIALLPLQLLWLNLMTDGLLGLSMGVEPAERRVMQRPPHTPGASLWAGGLGRRTVWIGLVIGIVSLGVGFVYDQQGDAAWQSMMFTTLAFMQVGQALGIRSDHDSLRTIGFWSNRTMVGVITVVIALQLLALYTPLRRVLGLEPLGLIDVGISAGLAAAFLVGLEVAKLRRRTAPGRSLGAGTGPSST